MTSKDVQLQMKHVFDNWGKIEFVSIHSPTKINAGVFKLFFLGRKFHTEKGYGYCHKTQSLRKVLRIIGYTAIEIGGYGSFMTPGVKVTLIYDGLKETAWRIEKL